MYSKLLLIIALFVSQTFAEQATQRKTADTDSSQSVGQAVDEIRKATQARRTRFNNDPLKVRQSYAPDNSGHETNIILNRLRGPVSSRHASDKEKEYIAKSIFAGDLVHGTSQSFQYTNTDVPSNSSDPLWKHYRILEILTTASRDYLQRIQGAEFEGNFFGKLGENDIDYPELESLSGINGRQIYSWFRDTYEGHDEGHVNGIKTLSQTSLSQKTTLGTEEMENYIMEFVGHERPNGTGVTPLVNLLQINTPLFVQMAVNRCVELYATAIMKGIPVPAEVKDALSYIPNHAEIKKSIASKIYEKARGSQGLIHVPRELPPFLQPYFERITGFNQRINTYMRQQDPDGKLLPDILPEAILHMETSGYYYLPKWVEKQSLNNPMLYQDATLDQMQKRKRLAEEQLYQQFCQHAKGYMRLEDAHKVYEQERDLAATERREMPTVYTHVVVRADAMVDLESRGRIHTQLDALCTQKPDLTVVIDFGDETRTPGHFGTRLFSFPEDQEYLPNTVRHVAVIGRNLHTTGNGFLVDCPNLISVHIPDSVREIGNGFLTGCTNLTSVDIPNSVRKIGAYFLSFCTNLTSVHIPNSITHIGDSFLYDCTNLTSVDIPNSVIKIGHGFLDGCTNLTSVNIPNSVTHIGDNFLTGCTNLTSVHIPNSVREIGNWFLEGCDALQNGSVVVNRDVKKFLDILRIRNPELARDPRGWFIP